MEVFIRFNSSLSLILILYLIVTSDFPHGAYCTNQLPLDYSATNINSPMLVNRNYALNADKTDKTRFSNNLGESSFSHLPTEEDDSANSPLNSHSPKISFSKFQPASTNDNGDGESSLTSPITEMETADSPNDDGSTDINFSPSNNIVPKQFSAVAHAILPARKRRSGRSRNEISKAQVPSPSSLRNPEASPFPERSERNSFPVAFLMGTIPKSPGDGGNTPDESVGERMSSTGSSYFSERLSTNDIIRRRARRPRSRNNTSENTSIPMENLADDGDEAGGGAEATTSINNSSNDNNQDVSLDIITASSPASLQASASMSDDEGATSTPQLQGSSSSPLETDNVGNDDNDSAGLNITNEHSNTTATTPEPGTTPLRGKCNETSQCWGEYVDCRLGICKCQLGYLPRVDNGDLCGEASAHHVEVPTTDPTMIGVVVGLALMSVTLCIVLRLFAKARFRENRTIFNTPNPRLMNVSLLKGSKTLLRGNSAGQRSRRGSQNSTASEHDGQSGATATPDGNGVSGTGAGSSSHPPRVKPSRTLSTDTTNLEGTPVSEGRSSRPLSSANRGKYRQDSVASNV